MFKFDNTHIFTGYLKQLLSSVNLPNCQVYTKEFADYYKKHGKEDPRVIESFNNIEYSYNSISKKRAAACVNYLKGNELFSYFWEYDQNKQRLNHDNTFWKRTSSIFYNIDKHVPGLTRTLISPGSLYDATTHEYLGDYLRFLRDYYNINLMSLYNCFNNKICNNIYYTHKVKVANPDFNIYVDESATNMPYKESSRVFDSRDSKYHIYAFPVKLFQNYTIAIDCNYEIEMFCGFYRTSLDRSNKSIDLIGRTYKKYNRTFFSQPFLYDKLDVKYWNFDLESSIQDESGYPLLVDSRSITRCDITNRERDLKLFIKIPASCKSSIVVLEGDFREFNATKYVPIHYKQDGSIYDPEVDDANSVDRLFDRTAWEYKQNHVVINFGDKVDLNENSFTPISRLQLLAFNTGESYPFADRLIEYLSGSAITPIDSISDNIKRAQEVMSQNHNYFKIKGLWENKMQQIIYDYMMNSGPIEVKDGKLVDRHSGHNPKNHGRHPRLGHTSKSTLYDILGYIDKDAEKWYSSWTKDGNRTKVLNNIQNVDIYNGLYDI